MITVYGIPNCSTVKKARDWLSSHQIDYVFHDFKKSGIDAARLNDWLDQLPLDKLINRQGTTWRKLDEAARQQAATREGAIALMQGNPSLIKRPVLVKDSGIMLGFTEALYEGAFGQ